MWKAVWNMGQSAYERRLRKDATLFEVNSMRFGIIVQVGVLIFIILAMIRTDGTWPPFANDSYWTCPLQVNSWWPILLFLAMTMMASAAVVADEPKGLRFSRDRQNVLPFWMRWLVAFIQISAAISSMVIVLSLPISAAS